MDIKMAMRILEKNSSIINSVGGITVVVVELMAQENRQITSIIHKLISNLLCCVCYVVVR